MSHLLYHFHHKPYSLHGRFYSNPWWALQPQLPNLSYYDYYIVLIRTVDYHKFEIFSVYTLMMKICLIIFGQIFVIHTIVQWEEKWPWSAFENVLYLSIVGVAASNLQYMSSNKQCHYQVPNLKETCSWEIHFKREYRHSNVLQAIWFLSFLS